MRNRFHESWNHLLDSIGHSIDGLEPGKVEEAVSMITDAENIFVYGAGRSGLVGRTFAMRLMQLGLNAFFIGETITPAVKDSDCVFFVSRTGETQTAIQAAEIVSERVEARSIVLTASPNSTLTEYADLVLDIGRKETKNDEELAPLGTIFEDTAVIFLDAMIAVLMEQLGESEECMKDRHPILV